jgi:hypothetical protein
MMMLLLGAGLRVLIGDCYLAKAVVKIHLPEQHIKRVTIELFIKSSNL